MGVVLGENQERTFPVKKLLAWTVVAAFVTMSAPAFAQSYDPSVGSGNIVSGAKGGMANRRSSGPLYNFAPMSGHHHKSPRAGETER